MAEKKWELTATVFIFSADKDRVLLVQREKEPMIGWWLPPGGHVEPLERPDTAAVREVAEETGLDIRLIDERPDLPAALDHITPRVTQPHHIQLEPIDQQHDHLDIIYFAHCDPLQQPSLSSAQWWHVPDVLGSDVVPDNVKETIRLWLARVKHVKACDLQEHGRSQNR